MRHIRKGAEPFEFRRWKQGNEPLADGAKVEHLSADARNALRRQMLRDQGFLCAYTMMSIAGETLCHIEHVKPQWRHPDLATDFGNMVLCVTGAQNTIFTFGAAAKGDTDVSEDDFVSPLHASCEQRLRYEGDGEVDAASACDIAALRTVKLLDLNNRYLIAARKRAVDEQLFGVGDRNPASIAAVRRWATSAFELQGDERLPPFCIAIKQVAAQQLARREQRARRLAGRQDR